MFSLSVREFLIVSQILNVALWGLATGTLLSYASFYHASRTHPALDGDSPDGRTVEPPEQAEAIAYPHHARALGPRALREPLPHPDGMVKSRFVCKRERGSSLG